MNTLNTDILEAIKKSISGMQADALKAFVDEAEANKKELKFVKGTLKDCQEEKDNLRNQLKIANSRFLDLSKEYADFKNKVGKLDQREKAVLDRENKQDIQTVRLEEANKRSGIVIGLFEKCLSNVAIRKTVFAETPIIQRNSYGDGSYCETVSNQQTTTTTLETKE